MPTLRGAGGEAPYAIVAGVERDEDLLRRWRDGDTRCGEALFARYYDRVSRFFANKVATDRADLVQATFSACLKKIDGLEKAASFRSFLFSIARFELLRHYRRKSRREVEFDAEQDTVCDLDPTPSRIIAKHEEQRLLLEGLRRIPVDLQIVLELTYWEKLTTAEIGDLLRIPTGTVKSRVRRARELLDRQLAELADSQQRLESTVSNLDKWAMGLREELAAGPGTASP